MLARLAQRCYRHRRVVLAAWLVVLVGTAVGARVTGGDYRLTFNIPNSDSQEAEDILAKDVPQLSGSAGQVVFSADQALAGSAYEARIAAVLAKVAAVPEVQSVTSPFGPIGGRQISSDGHIAFAQLQFDNGQSPLDQQVVTTIEQDVDAARGDGLDIELGGGEFQAQQAGDPSEAVGLLAAVIILLFAFGSALAMGLPITTALFGVGIGLSGITLLSNLFSIPSFTIQLAAMIGIGVGIDYALFIVTRYRQALASGIDPEQAVVQAVSTSGKAVLFAGCTVVISLCGMFLMGISLVRGLAVGASLAVLVTMAVAVTLLPAVLGFVGANIDRFGLPWASKGAAVADRGMWYRWSRFIQRRRWPAAVLSLLLLVVLGLPVFSMRLGTSDASNLSRSDTTRRAYDLLSDGFGPGFNGPLLIAIRVPDKAAAASLDKVQAAVAKTSGIKEATPAVSSQNGDAAVIEAEPVTGPKDERTVELIHHLRDQVLPDASRGTGLEAHVGGVTAAFDDLANLLSARLPLFIGAVLVLSFILLMCVFRSLAVPLKAVIMNLLSIGAAYGVLVAVFQWGWGKDLIGVGSTGPIESFLPMTMFAILFGLSMDYEVFLLSRIKEEYDKSGDNASAVADGLSQTARVITAAASIMVCVFLAFVFSANPVVKEFGVGMAAAVLIDASIVRMVLVPATMELLGKANWWLPHGLDRVLPDIRIEGAEEKPAAVPSPTPAQA